MISRAAASIEASVDDERMTIVGLVAHTIRGWAAAAESDEEFETTGTCAGGAYCVFYIDAAMPNAIHMRGAEADRCELWVKPSSVRSGLGGVELLVGVKIAHRRDGTPAVIEFEMALTEELTPRIH
jgi:hypothetical protein